MLDEFETLDRAFAQGRFDEDRVLGMFRHLIQHRPRVKILLAGSHLLDEMQRWANYLINVQVVHLSYLGESETRRLVERPVEGFALRYDAEAVNRVIALTRGHPFLVQLLCGEIVALKNEQPDLSSRRQGTVADVEAAARYALSTGQMFFHDIQTNQVNAVGVSVLHEVAAQGPGAVVTASDLHHSAGGQTDAVLDGLVRRELLERTPKGVRFQVELVRRWFA
jgi:hypothetical protein